MTKGNEKLYITQTVDMYKGYSDKIHFEQKDPTKDPVFARSLGTDVTDNSVIVKSGERAKVIDSSTVYDSAKQQGVIEFQLEQKLTRAIAYVQAESDVKVYFTTGHEEIDYHSIKIALEDENADVYEIDLTTAEIPDDAAAVYIMAPQMDFSEDEISKIQSYLSNGGGLNVSLGVKSDDLPELRRFLSDDWGINFNNDIVMETDSMAVWGGDPFYVLPSVVQHSITEGIIDKKTEIAWPEARSLHITEVPDVKASVLLTTTENALSKAAAESVSYTAEDEDIQGKHILAVVCEKDSKTSAAHIIATGTCFYADKLCLNDMSLANSDFVRECFVYLRGNDSKGISIIPKNVSNTYMSLKQGEIYAYMWIFGIVPEILVLAAGLVVWLRRRRL